ncbi:MAG: AAA family ATPase [Thermoplasmata archaeon]
MEELRIQQPDIIGREAELAKLRDALDNAISGKGSTFFVSGEAGIGKTRLVSELISEVEKKGAQIIRGWCLAESMEPLMPIKVALRESGLSHLISGDPPPLVLSAYLMNDAGMLISKVERLETNIDSDIFAGMLQAVGNFIQDSLSSTMGRDKGASLNSLGYGDYNILIQSAGNLSFAVVIKGTNSEFLIEDMKTKLRDIGNQFDGWIGDMASARNVQPKISWFVDSGKYDGKFLVDDPKIKQENLFDNILIGLQRASKDAPLMLFLDDMQWSDPTSLNLIHYLSRNTRDNRILILGTYRPEDIIEGYGGGTHNLETIMQAMSREALFEKIELKRLDADNTMRIVESILGKNTFDKSVFEKIFNETEGSPLFILEIVKFLAEDKAIGCDENGAWEFIKNPNELEIPSKIYDVVKRRLNRLDKEQKDILECASIIGEEFKSEILGTVTGFNRMQLLKNLSDIEKRHQLIHFVQNLYRFDHAKVKEVLYHDIGKELRRE